MGRWLEIYGTGNRVRSLVFYMAATSVVGFAVLCWAVRGPLPCSLTLMLYMALGILGQHLSVQFPDGNSMSLADPVIYAALWSFGAPLAIFIQVSAVMTQLFTQKKALLNTTFNAAQFVMSIASASVWVRLSSVTANNAPLVQIILVLLMVLTFDLVNHLFVTIAVSIDQEHKLSEVFPRIAFAQRKKTFVLGYLINMAGVLLATYMGLAGIIFVFAGVFVLWIQLQFEQELVRKSIEAQTDPLTGLLNVRYLEDWLEKDFPRLSPDKDRCSVIFIDVDGLKSVNDHLGHDAGDAVLVHLARVLTSVVRSEDKVIRYGGDEFVLICDKAELSVSRDITERILNALERSSLVRDGTTIAFGVSAGMASFPIHSILGRDLVRMADKAMYLAKKDGGNRCYTADSL